MKSSYVAAGVVVVALCLWMASGLLTSGKDADANTTVADAETAPMKVEVIDIELSSMAREIILQGQLEPARQLLVRAETSGTIDSIEVIKGDRVAANTALATLALNGRDNELREAQAQVRTAASEQQAAKSLRKQGLQSQVQLEQAQARLESTRAQLARIELDIARTQIVAPFAGVINDLPIEAGELIERGSVVAQLVDDSAFLVSAQAAQQTIASLSVGQEVLVRLITGQSLAGKLTFISSIADRKTRSFTVEAEVANEDGHVAAGVSASLVIPVEQVMALFISPSALSLGDDGELGVKVVNEKNTVEFVPISLVSSSTDGAWITGVPQDRRLITLGQGFVNAGQQVDPRPATIMRKATQE